MKDPTRRTKQLLLLMCFMLLVAPAPVSGARAPAPPQMAINDGTKQCAEFSAGDECVRCTLTDGWKSIGFGAVCPLGYSMVETSPVNAPVVVCKGSSNQFCCSEGSSGGPGDCDDMVINNDKELCAFVKGGIESCGNTNLPPGWTMQPENSDRRCPKDYTWVDTIKFCPCRKITVDFDKAADGTPIKRGDYVTDQWKSLGLTVAASGTESSKKGARIFDTTNPGRRKAGDPDLGAPNKRCTPAGPGIGLGGEPGEPGKKGVNCKPQGNALIVQEDNGRPDVPNDNRNGGTLTMNFKAKRRYVYEMGLLDINDAATVDIVFVNGKGVSAKKTRRVPELGDNSFQVFKINQVNVTRIILTMEGSGAVTFISFCA